MPHSKNENTEIIVNSIKHYVSHSEVAFDQVVTIAYPDGKKGPLITYTVNFYSSADNPDSGKLTAGKKIKVKNGTVFNVTRTDRS